MCSVSSPVTFNLKSWIMNMRRLIFATTYLAGLPTTLDLKLLGGNRKFPSVALPQHIVKDLAAHRVSVPLQLHRSSIDASVERANKRLWSIIVGVHDHLNDSPLAITQDSRLEVAVLETHSTTVVEKLDTQILVALDGIHHSSGRYVLRVRRYR